MDQISSESTAHVWLRENTVLDRLLAECNRRCVIFGAGTMGQRALSALRSVGVHPLSFADNNPVLWGKSVEGIPILSPEDAAKLFGADAVFFIAIRNENHWYRQTFDQLQHLGCAHISSSEPIAWRFPDKFPPFLLYNLPHNLYAHAEEVVRAATLWADEESTAEYAAQIQLRAFGDPMGLSRPDLEESYILPGVFQLGPEDVFLDCGAYDGDTIRNLIDNQIQFGMIEAVEADTHSFARLANYISSLAPDVTNRIRLHQCAVGASRSTVRFDDTGGVDSKVSDEGRILIDMVPIDVMFASKRVSMIKMDIEGGEYDALIGAQQVIQRDRPILAICVYHSQEDIWRLPLLIRKLCPEHRMYLKAYRGDGIQTVVYAVPPERVLGSRQDF
ncbi:MAG TPA: FkbM family methyltransferase [Acidobacteriaceae bacterium]|nr:FkbM family methyltransferase [Acidobacteriaceae bacterium]